MKILVTGATGYIGKALVPQLLERGHVLRILARPTSDTSAFEGDDRIEVFKGDITKEETLRGISQNIEAVYHLAVLGHLSHAENDEEYFNVNDTGSINLLKQFIGSPVKTFLFTTTSAALGPISGKIVTEEDFSPPVTAYGQSKYKAELSIKEFAQKNSIPAIMVRLTHVYGPGETRDLYRMIKMIKKGIFPQIGFSPNLYPAVYIDDAVRGIISAMEKGTNGETYIISDHTSHDTRDIRRLVLQYLGIKSRFYPFLPKYLSLALFSVLDLISQITGIKFPVKRKNIQFMSAGRMFSIEKARKELGYEPKVSLEEGLKKTIDYYLEKNLL